MSNGNSIPEHPEITRTATVAIFSPDMKRTLLIFNEHLMAIVPPGGKQDDKDKGSICRTGRREVREEVGIDLETTSGIWLGIRGNRITDQKVVRRAFFTLNGKNFIDSLFFYQLIGNHQNLYDAEKRGEWYAKKTLQPETILLDGRAYGVLVPGTREAVFNIMKGPI
ncbi:MAG: hypothetical protein WC753_04350 [Candidatus Gracilibacteria bacterium]